jgi:hypothetical protein
MEKFEIGEVAILHGLVRWPEHNGEEVEIISESMVKFCHDPRGGDSGLLNAHSVVFQNGEKWCIAVINLKKKRPPSTDEAYRIATDLFDRLTLRVPA